MAEDCLRAYLESLAIDGEPAPYEAPELPPMRRRYSRLAVGGILIIDDHGTFQGARLATNQFTEENKLPIFLSRIDRSVRLVVKPQL